MLKNAFWLFAVAMLVLIVFLPSFTIMQEQRGKNLEYERRLTELKEKNKELEKEKRLLLEDPVYLEKVAREEMGLVREGEVIYRLTPVDKKE